MKNLLLIGFITMLFGACNSTPTPKDDNPEEKKENKEEQVQIEAPKDVKFVCDNFEENENGKVAIVKLMVDGKESFRDTINNCDGLGKGDFEAMGIPAAALDVSGGWWAGGGDYFYVILKDNKPVVYAGWQDEQQEDKGYHWEEVK